MVNQRAVYQAAGSRGRSVNVITTLSPETGWVYHEIHIGRVNTTIFNNFFFNLSIQFTANARFSHHISVLDNAAIHNQDRDVVVTDKHTIQKLTPYSPMLSRIKLAFSAPKASIKHFPKHLLRVLLENSLPTITAEKCRGWCKHTYRHLY